MTSLTGQIIFNVAARTYYWEDAVLASVLWGEWSALENRVTQGLACMQRLAVIGKEIAPSTVEAEAAEFRYERDLVAAADAETWLARWNLSAEEWMGYIRRTILRKRWADTVETFASKYPSDSDMIARAMHAELVCSGAIQRVAKKLSGRAAMYDYLTSQPHGWQDDPASVAREADRFPAGINEYGIAGISSERCRERIPVVASLEAALSSFRDAVVTPRALKDHIAMHHLDWIRFDYQSLAFDREDMAREAALCIREDAMLLAEVGASSNTEVRKEQRFLDEIDRGLRDRFLGAKEGELLGPIAVNGGYCLYMVSNKRLPSAEDAAVRQRAEQSAFSSALGYEARQRVKWQVTM